MVIAVCRCPKQTLVDGRSMSASQSDPDNCTALPEMTTNNMSCNDSGIVLGEWSLRPPPALRARARLCIRGFVCQFNLLESVLSHVKSLVSLVETVQSYGVCLVL